MKRMSLLLVLVAGMCLGPARSMADEDKAPKRTISVSGTATVQVVPDEVVLIVGVEKLDVQLDGAVKGVRTGIKNALTVAKETGVEEKDLQTARLNIQPQYEDRSSYLRKGGKLTGYLATGQIAITLREPAKCEELITSLLKVGINTIDDIQFRSSKTREHRDKARLMAVQAAKEKAALLAGEFGMKVGKPVTIADDPAPYYDYPQVNAAAFDRGHETRDEEGRSVALGQIAIVARVSVTFDLE